MTTVAFILASWRPDVAAGMERAVTTHAVSIVATGVGHRGIIITADPSAPKRYRNIPVITLRALHRSFPCDDITLRQAVDRAADALRAELTATYIREAIDAAVYVDALWGLGRIMPTHPRTRNVLAAHVVGHDQDLRAALARRPPVVMAPSTTVLTEAAERGYDTSTWHVIPNTLFTEPEPQPEHIRDRLRRRGPVRVLARLGPEKGIAELIAARTAMDRPVQVALADAPFEGADGGQRRLLDHCRDLAARTPGLTIRPGLTWDQVPAWLGDAALVIVPSLAETFGLVALEAMAAGTPVVAHDVGNLPHLIANGGVIVPQQRGPSGLWRAAQHLLGDGVQYRRTSRAAYYRSRDYWPAQVANQLLKVVS